MKDSYVPGTYGSTCPALINENYDYHLSGDCDEFCRCIINGKKCIGRVIEDRDDASTQFFSRAMCLMNEDLLNKCPMYGLSKETFALIIKEKLQLEMDKKLASVGLRK